jgi:putative transposase
MPGRLMPLISGEVYHVYNRGIARQPTFLTSRDFLRAAETLKYYQFNSPSVRLSYFLSYGVDKRNEIMKQLTSSGRNILIFSYAFMPNHFHFLVRQNLDNGIAKVLSNFQNSYTRYFNTKRKRDGSLFLDQFKAVRIETDEQFLHVVRYIHLNPYTSYIVKSVFELDNYQWSSYQAYLNGVLDICDTTFVLNHFSSVSDFKKFHKDQADYQRNLGSIKHLMFE